MLADYQDLVAQAVRDDSGRIAADDIVAAIGLAVARYSQDRPRLIVADLPAAGDATLPLPEGWEDEFSAPLAAEYPVGEFPPVMLDSDRFGAYQFPLGWVLRFAFIPQSPVRLTYTQAHRLTDDEDTIPVKHREAVACWAAAYCYDQLAGYYAGATDSTLQADKVERGAQGRDFAARASALRKRYFNELGLDDKKSAPAGVVVDLDLSSSYGGDRFTHSNRRR